MPFKTGAAMTGRDLGDQVQGRVSLFLSRIDTFVAQLAKVKKSLSCSGETAPASQLLCARL